MVERIDKLKYSDVDEASRRERRETNLYATGPAEFLTAEIAYQISQVEVFKELFGESIDGTKRMDYSYRNLPALRIYNDRFVKTYESWFVEGDVLADVIFPPSIRRADLSQIPSTVSNALLQQFRRTAFFNALDERIPGLNQLGREFDVDKSLAFQFGDDLVPLTQIRLNFKLDLREWDDYLVDDNRTVDDPFERTLGDLREIITTIQGLEDDDDINVTFTSEQDQD
jgi:hypothetical protein